MVTTFEASTERVRRLVASALDERASDPEKYRVYLEHGVTLLHDAWAVGCRRLIWSSAVGGFATCAGAVLPRATKLPRRQGVGKYLRQKWTPGKKMQDNWEPDWHIPAQAIRAAKLLEIPNIAEVETALGACIHADHLRLARNVIAHSIPQTWAKLREYQRQAGLTGHPTVADTISTRHPPDGNIIIHTWSEDLKECLRAAAR